MSRYAKIDTRTWGDEKFRTLSKPQPNAQSLFIYLLTGPHHLGPGCFEAGEYGLAEKLRWPIEGFRAAFAELEAAGMVRADWDAHVVCLVNAMKHDPPANANVVKHWCDLLDSVPECRIRTAYATELKRYAERFQKPFEDGSPNGMPIPEPKPEPSPLQEPKQEPRERDAHARAADEPPVPVVASMSEVSEDRPYALVAMLCEENDREIDGMPAPWRSQQLGIAKRLLENHSIEQTRLYVRYRKTAWNGGTPFDLRHVEKDIGAWELAGEPSEEVQRRAPPSRGERKVDAIRRTADGFDEAIGATNGHDESGVQGGNGAAGGRLRPGAERPAVARLLGPAPADRIRHLP